jgi:hypothetical protein
VDTAGTILLAFDIGGIIEYYASHRVLSENFVLRNEEILHFNQQILLSCEGGLLCLEN